MAHAPPVPPEQQSPVGHGGPAPQAGQTDEAKRDPAGSTADVALLEEGSIANIAQNTPQSYQQDR